MICFFRKSLLLQCSCGGKDNKAYTQAIVIILRNNNYTQMWNRLQTGADLTKCHLTTGRNDLNSFWQWGQGRFDMMYSNRLHVYVSSYSEFKRRTVFSSFIRTLCTCICSDFMRQRCMYSTLQLYKLKEISKVPPFFTKYICAFLKPGINFYD